MAEARQCIAFTDVAPELSVVVPSHDRPLRLRWLLNALQDQTLPTDRWEVVVAHDSSGPETEALLREHPLATAGILRHVTLAPGSAPPGANRNAGWRAARSETVVFTDDDCRPPSDWLEQAARAAREHPGAIVQGVTIPDPHEASIRHAPHTHSQWIVRPPTPWAQTCNIIYPRGWLERMGGFDESAFVGEDTDLNLRAQKAGAEYLGDLELLTYHAVDELSLWRRVRGLWRWKGLPWLVKRHPNLRASFPMWMFWKRTHVWLPFAVLGVLLGRRNLLYLMLAIPYVVHTAPNHGGGAPRPRYRSLMEVPSRIVVDATEFAACARGSIKERTLFL